MKVEMDMPVASPHRRLGHPAMDSPDPSAVLQALRWEQAEAFYRDGQWIHRLQAEMASRRANS